MVFREQPGQSVFPWSSESVSLIMELNNFVSVIYFPNDDIHEPKNKFIPYLSVQKFEETKTECLVYKTIVEDVR